MLSTKPTSNHFPSVVSESANRHVEGKSNSQSGPVALKKGAIQSRSEKQPTNTVQKSSVNSVAKKEGDAASAAMDSYGAARPHKRSTASVPSGERKESHAAKKDETVRLIGKFSGLDDYYGPGSKSKKPTTQNDFMKNIEQFAELGDTIFQKHGDNLNGDPKLRADWKNTVENLKNKLPDLDTQGPKRFLKNMSEACSTLALRALPVIDRTPPASEEHVASRMSPLEYIKTLLDKPISDVSKVDIKSLHSLQTNFENTINVIRDLAKTQPNVDEKTLDACIDNSRQFAEREIASTDPTKKGAMRDCHHLIESYQEHLLRAVHDGRPLPQLEPTGTPSTNSTPPHQSAKAPTSEQTSPSGSVSKETPTHRDTPIPARMSRRQAFYGAPPTSGSDAQPVETSKNDKPENSAWNARPTTQRAGYTGPVPSFDPSNVSTSYTNQFYHPDPSTTLLQTPLQRNGPLTPSLEAALSKSASPASGQEKAVESSSTRPHVDTPKQTMAAPARSGEKSSSGRAQESKQSHPSRGAGSPSSAAHKNTANLINDFFASPPNTKGSPDLNRDLTIALSSPPIDVKLDTIMSLLANFKNGLGALIDNPKTAISISPSDYSATMKNLKNFVDGLAGDLSSKDPKTLMNCYDKVMAELLKKANQLDS